MKLAATSGTSRVNRLQSLVKGILGQVLAFFPIACQAINRMEDQFAIFMNERFYCLSSRHRFHYKLFSLASHLRATLMEMHEHGEM